MSLDEDLNGNAQTLRDKLLSSNGVNRIIGVWSWSCSSLKKGKRGSEVFRKKIRQRKRIILSLDRVNRTLEDCRRDSFIMESLNDM